MPRPGAPATVGTKFIGSNRRGKARRVTSCRVTAAAPGERFTFVVTAIGPEKPLVNGRIATRSYVLEPVERGTRVTESWTGARPGWSEVIVARFDRFVTGGHVFADFQ